MKYLTLEYAKEKHLSIGVGSVRKLLIVQQCFPLNYVLKIDLILVSDHGLILL